MEVLDGRFDTRKVVHVVDAFGGRLCAVQHEVESVDDVFGGGDLIVCIEGFPFVLAVEDDSICVFILDILNWWYPP